MSKYFWGSKMINFFPAKEVQIVEQHVKKSYILELQE